MNFASPLYVIMGTDREAAVSVAREQARAGWYKMMGQECPDEYLVNAKAQFCEQGDKRRRPSVENPPARHVVTFPVLAGAITARMSERGAEQAREFAALPIDLRGAPCLT